MENKEVEAGQAARVGTAGMSGQPVAGRGNGTV